MRPIDDGCGGPTTITQASATADGGSARKPRHQSPVLLTYFSLSQNIAHAASAPEIKPRHALTQKSSRQLEMGDRPRQARRKAR